MGHHSPLAPREPLNRWGSPPRLIALQALQLLLRLQALLLRLLLWQLRYGLDLHEIHMTLAVRAWRMKHDETTKSLGDWNSGSKSENWPDWYIGHSRKLMDFMAIGKKCIDGFQAICSRSIMLWHHDIWYRWMWMVYHGIYLYIYICK